MNDTLQPLGDLTERQLLERERSLRIMASTALTPEESTALLALAEQYESITTHRQGSGYGEILRWLRPPSA
jgi:hypothetical protein